VFLTHYQAVLALTPELVHPVEDAANVI